MKVMSVEILKSAGALEYGRPKVVFQRPPAGLRYTNLALDYAVTSDGQRFLANTVLEEADTSPIIVITNWTSRLKTAPKK